MQWLFETCVLSDERVAELREACDALGLRRTFTLDIDQPPEPRRARPDHGAEVVAYGSKSVIGYAERMGWRPGAWSGPAFDYANVQKGLGSLFLNADAVAGRLDNIEQTAKLRSWDRIFIRPADDNKAFAGVLMDIDAIAEWRGAMVKSGYLSDSSLAVVAAEPQGVKREWRIVLAEDELAGASLYRDASGPKRDQGCPAEVFGVAQEAARIYRPAPVFVADVAEAENDRLAIVEYNAFNSADLYACDIKSVVERVTSAAQRGL